MALNRLIEVIAAPYDHFAAGPHCRLIHSANWRIGIARSYPTISGRIVSPTGVQKVSVLVVGKKSTPNNHFTAGPYRRVFGSRREYVARTSVCPVIRNRIVSPASVHRRVAHIISAPYDHLAASPYCSVKISTRRRIDGAGGCPTIRAGVVSPASTQKDGAIVSAPHNHLTASPDGCVTESRSRRISSANNCPTVRVRIVSSTGIEVVRKISSAPDDHFAAIPHCRVRQSRAGCIGVADGCPAVCGGIVYPPGTDSWRCGWCWSRGRNRRVEWLRNISAGVEIGGAAISAPNNHFTAGPHCRMA